MIRRSGTQSANADRLKSRAIGQQSQSPHDQVLVGLSSRRAEPAGYMRMRLRYLAVHDFCRRLDSRPQGPPLRPVQETPTIMCSDCRFPFQIISLARSVSEFFSQIPPLLPRTTVMRNPLLGHSGCCTRSACGKFGGGPLLVLGAG